MPSSMSRWSAAAALLYWLLGIACAALLLRWAAQPGPLAPSDGQLTRQRASGLIYGEERLAQVVAVPRDGLAAVQFWMLVHRRDEPGNVVLRVAALDAPEMPLAIIAIPLRDMPAAPPVTFPLPPFDRATTPSLLLTLEAPELDRDHAPSVLGADNLYGSGLLMVNGRPRNSEDLAFQLLSRPLQGDRLLPLSRLASGRPGPFGWPPLYLLLPIAVLWVGAWAVGWLVGAVARGRFPLLIR
jgi:hypothetical protein